MFTCSRGGDEFPLRPPHLLGEEVEEGSSEDDLPVASASGLPCSCVRMLASSALCSSIRSPTLLR